MERAPRLEPQVVVITALALYLLATGRWGSYVPVPGVPFYVSDGVIILACAVLLLVVARSGGVLRWSRTALAPPLVAILIWTTFRLAAGGDFSLVALRDAAPYFYVVVGLMVLTSPGYGSRWNVLRFLRAALIVRLLWVAAVTFLPVPALPEVARGVPLLGLRGDVDTASASVLAALALRRILTRKTNPWTDYIWLVLALAVLVRLETRAGLVALVVLVSVVLIATISSGASLGARRRAAVIAFLVPLVVTAILTVAPRESSVRRLQTALNFVVPIERLDPIRGVGSGTVRTRLRAWEAVIEDVATRPHHSIFGVGFGVDYVDRSGAVSQFVGQYGREREIRSPHNFLLNTWARLGLVGLSCYIYLLAVLGYRVMLMVMRGSSETEMAFLLLASAYVVVAVFGVVLEAPFGAIPTYWAIGAVGAGALSQPAPRSRTDGPPAPQRLALEHV